MCLAELIEDPLFPLVVSTGIELSSHHGVIYRDMDAGITYLFSSDRDLKLPSGIEFSVLIIPLSANGVASPNQIEPTAPSESEPADSSSDALTDIHKNAPPRRTALSRQLAILERDLGDQLHVERLSRTDTRRPVEVANCVAHQSESTVQMTRRRGASAGQRILRTSHGHRPRARG